MNKGLRALLLAVVVAGTLVGINAIAEGPLRLDAPVDYASGASEIATLCDPGSALASPERAELLTRLSTSSTGQAILSDFRRHFGGYENLVIQWDSVSYSQVVSPAHGSGRAPAGASKLGSGVCIHLTKRLPNIEHVADLAHELAHATRLSPEVLKGDVDSVDEFVRARLTSRGGEADAFTAECHVKSELLGRWDELCAPYAGKPGEGPRFDTERVVKDLYNGQLSASLTGETYPVMLARQYKAMLAKKARVKYVNDPYAKR